ncbi:hypothetical protein VTG60DRAFT_2568 [Thermothelomyces hinnuleus]
MSGGLKNNRSPTPLEDRVAVPESSDALRPCSQTGSDRVPGDESGAEEKKGQMAQELPDDAKYALGRMKAQIDQLQAVISQMREENAEFEIRLQTEAQLRREMEMWWADKFPKEHEKSAHIQTRSPVLKGVTSESHAFNSKRTAVEDGPALEFSSRGYHGASRGTRRILRAVGDPDDDVLGFKAYRESKQNSCGDFDQSFDEDPGHSSPSASRTIVDKINRVGWDEFRDSIQRRKPAIRGTVFVLDVLVGHPPPTLGLSELSLRSRTVTQDLSPTSRGAAPFLPAKQCSLPERIRINSPELLRICFQIENELNPGYSRSYRDVQELKPKVMIQPFKTLVYNAERIRGCYRQLDENLKRSPDVRATKGLDTQPEPGAEPKRHQDEQNIRNLAQPASERQDPVVAPSLFSSIEDERRARDHLRCLLEFIDGDLKERTEHIRGGNCSRVTFGELWLLFQPGDIVLWNSAPQVALVLGTVDPGHKDTKPFRGGGLRRRDKKKEEDEEDDCFVIMCVSIEFDGVQLGPSSSMVKIPRFEGEKAIRSLPIYPLAYSSTPNARETYIARGKKFLEMTKIRHMYYTGQTVDPATTYVDSQVVIDAEEAFRQWPRWRPDIENLVGIDIETEVTGSAGRRPRVCNGQCCQDDLIFEDGDIEVRRNADYMDSLIPQDRSQMPSLCIYPRTLEDIETSSTKISDLEYLIMPFSVYGFVMRTRKWARLNLEMLSPVTRLNPDADLISRETPGTESGGAPFDQLVLPPGHKEMVLSLVSQHFRDKESNTFRSMDIVRGKGQGLIILLHGAPGVGKTSTAECVAEHFNKPLFHITCGDLGVFASDVESALERSFALASRWGCILLLDEADVFLSARSPTDFLRNCLVSVFLRVLEYYSGCLFLTTNRVGDFDEAFTSRIHLSLYYPPLNLVSTQRVVSLNLERIEKGLKQKNIKLHADMVSIGGFIANYWHEHPRARWNGRQIRNACRTASALAEFESTKMGSPQLAEQSPSSPQLVSLEAKHFKQVADAYLDFTEYLKDIYGVHADERAKENFLRAAVKDPGGITRAATYPLMTRRSQRRDSLWAQTPSAQRPGMQETHGYDGGSGLMRSPSEYSAQDSIPTNSDGGRGYSGTSYHHDPPSHHHRHQPYGQDSHAASYQARPPDGGPPAEWGGPYLDDIAPHSASGPGNPRGSGMGLDSPHWSGERGFAGIQRTSDEHEVEVDNSPNSQQPWAGRWKAMRRETMP